jgi:Trk-type K+ transport system membrane component
LPGHVIGLVVFFSLYSLCCSVLTVVLLAFDIDALLSVSAAVAALSNVDPGLGSNIRPAIMLRFQWPPNGSYVLACSWGAWSFSRC